MNTNYALSTNPLMAGVISQQLINEANAHGLTFSVNQSQGVVSPRNAPDADITSVLVTGSKGRSASLGDQRMITNSSYSCVADAIDAYAINNNLLRDDLMCFTIYKREMGDIQLSTQPFPINANGSIAGFMFESRAKLRAEFGVQRVSPRLAKQIETRLQKELDELTAWANGKIFDIELLDDEGYVVERLDSVYDVGHNVNEAADELLSMCIEMA